jgi:hypothetical protein
MALFIRHLILLVGVAHVLVAASVPDRRFSVLPGGEADWTGIYYQQAPSSGTPLTFNHQARSRPQKITARDLVFTRDKIDPSTGRVVRVPVARAMVEERLQMALLVFRPKAVRTGEGLEFDVVVFDDGIDSFPSDSVRILNLTPIPLLGRVGSQTLEVPAGISHALRVKDVILKDGGVPLGLATKDGGETSLLHLSPLELIPRGRSLVMVLPPRTPQSMNVHVHVVVQVLPPERIASAK